MADLPFKRPEDLTPTEIFILHNGNDEQKSKLGFQLAPPGTPPPPGLLDRFKQGVSDAAERGRQIRAEYKYPNAVLNDAKWTAPALHVGGSPLASLALTALDEGTRPKVRDPVSFERTDPREEAEKLAPKPAAEESRFGPQLMSPYSLPDAKLSPGSGGGVGAPAERTGLGSDRALQNAQRDRISGQQAVVDKRMDEGAAHVDFLNREADVEAQKALLRRTYADAQKQVDDDQRKDEEGYAQKIVDAREKAAKMGVDPGRQFRGRETQSAIMLSIGGAISGALAALQGNQDNPFVKAVRQNVQDDVDVQNKEIDQAWRGVAGMETTYQQLVKRGVDKKLAQATYYGQVLDSHLGVLQSALAKAKIPEEKARIEGAIQSLQNERSDLDVSMQQYWKGTYERRAAAAAAQARADAERIWNHKMELAKLELARENAETHRMEVLGKAGAAGSKEASEGAKHISEKLQTAGVPQMRQLTEAALQALNTSPGGRAEATARAVAGGFPGGESMVKGLLSEDRNAREQAFQAFANLNMNQLSGGAISEPEERRLKAQLGTASDPEARRRALTSVLEKLDAVEKNVRAGASDEANAEYDRRMGAVTAGQPTAPEGSKKGW